MINVIIKETQRNKEYLRNGISLPQRLNHLILRRKFVQGSLNYNPQDLIYKVCITNNKIMQ